MAHPDLNELLNTLLSVAAEHWRDQQNVIGPVAIRNGDDFANDRPWLWI